MKKIFAIAIAALFAVSANAQECCKAAQGCCGGGFTPSWFVNLQGGVQMPYTPGNRKDLLSPAFSINIGRNITPLMSVRASFMGYNAKSLDMYVEGLYNDFKYYTGSFDAMLNVSNLFAKKYCHPLNVYAFAGVGANRSDAPTNNSSQYSPNVRVGAQIDWRVAKNLALNLEYRADNTNDQFNGRIENGTHDWYSTILLGVSLVLPDRKPVVDRSAEIDELNARINALQAENAALKNRKPEVKTVEVVKREAILPNVFFQCAKSDIELQQMANVKAIADYMKANEDVKVTISGYASPEGKAEFNQKLSEDRANAVADMLVQKFGISADRISTKAGGPTSDIYPENELNRVAVSVAK